MQIAISASDKKADIFYRPFICSENTLKASIVERREVNTYNCWSVCQIRPVQTPEPPADY